MSTAGVTTKRMTVEEFVAWASLPENENKWVELVRGEVIELPPPTRAHGVICGNVSWLLNVYVRERGKGYVTTNDSGVILEREPDTVRGPDVALYEDAQTFAELHPQYGEVPPVLAVEVLSSSDRAGRMSRKVTDYLRGGVALVWLVDPETRTVNVYPADNGPRLVLEDEELDGGEFLPGLRCRVADFFHLPGEQQAAKPTPPKPKPPPKRRRT